MGPSNVNTMTQFSLDLIVTSTMPSVTEHPVTAEPPIVAEAVFIPDVDAEARTDTLPDDDFPTGADILTGAAPLTITKAVDAVAKATPSAVSLTPGKALTIADAQAAVADWVGIPAKRKQKLLTALSTAARVLSPSQPNASAATSIQMDCPTLSRLLQAPAATFGLSPGRMTSLASELRAVLRYLNLHDPDYRGAPLRSPVLQACEAALPAHLRNALVDFFRWLDREQIPPEAVDADTLATYQTRLRQRTLCADAAERARQVAKAWNWACQRVPDWPGALLTRPKRGDRYSYALETYPITLQQDVARYAERLRGDDLDRLFRDDIFTEDGTPPLRFQRPLRAASIDSRLWIIRCAAGALVHTGVEQKQITSLRDLVYPAERAKTIIRYFLDRVGNGKPNPMAGRVGLTLMLLARDFCGLDEADVTLIAGWAKQVKPPEPNGLTPKNLRRLRAIIQPRARAMLLNFPQELLRRAATPGLVPAEAARLVMYAVAMEILLICPMRRKNLAELRIDHHLFRPDPRRRRLTHLLIPSDDVKNGNAIEWPIPPETARMIETFLLRHRPHLVEPGNPYLFGTGDKLRSAQHLGEWLSSAVTEAIGVEFNVHLARHFAAWNFLRENPGQYEVIRQVLGHRSIQVTMTYYVGLEADSAAAHFDKTVLRDRHAGRRIAKHAFRHTTPPKFRK